MENEKESLKEELDEMNREQENLYGQIKELESRPIDVAVSESDPHEIANLKEAMKICDNQWAEKYNELQESTIIRNREIHQKYKEEIDKLTAEYEQKLADIPTQSAQPVPDIKETFRFYYSMTYNAFNTMLCFVKKQASEDKQFCLERTDKLINLLKKDMQGV